MADDWIGYGQGLKVLSHSSCYGSEIWTRRMEKRSREGNSMEKLKDCQSKGQESVIQDKMESHWNPSTGQEGLR